MKSNSTTLRNQVDAERGMTLVEVTIASTLIIAILGLTHSSALAVHEANQFGEAKMAREATSRDVLAKVGEELKGATLPRDPRTNQYRYTIDNSGTPPKLTFQVLAGAQMVGTEIQAIWSSDIVITTSNDGVLTRTQNGRVTVLGRRIKTMTFETTLTGKFKLTAVTEQLNRKTGKLVDVADFVYIQPDN